MGRKHRAALLAAVLLLGLGLLTAGCAPDKPVAVKTGSIADGTIDPAVWGHVYPVQYDLWRATADLRPAGESPFKRGGDQGSPVVDKLSEFPFMALLFNGWGFGVEYNEPRGHADMLTDQLEVDAARVKAGGVCLTCKTPYAQSLQQQMGTAYFSGAYRDVHAKIPASSAKLGVACIDCHDNKTMALQLSRPALKDALTTLGADPSAATRQEMRSLVCAQCHVTYVVKKDAAMKSAGLFFPWQGSRPGDISMENIIKVLKAEPSYLEWKQAVTGFKVGFIRHPEYEFFTRGSVHARAGLSCADCHMPFTRVGASKVSDHDVTSPLKDGLDACSQCHPSSAKELKAQVVAIQERTLSFINRAGYATAVAAKLFERVHAEDARGVAIDRDLYDRAKDLYLEAFYRTVFLGAENSVGFHNPSEAGRIGTDAVAMASQAQALLRQGLSQAGVSVPATIDLELARYLDGRGTKKLGFDRAVELPDPSGVQDLLTPRASLGL